MIPLQYMEIIIKEIFKVMIMVLNHLIKILENIENSLLKILKVLNQKNYLQNTTKEKSQKPKSH